MTSDSNPTGDCPVLQTVTWRCVGVVGIAVIIVIVMTAVMEQCGVQQDIRMDLNGGLLGCGDGKHRSCP